MSIDATLWHDKLDIWNELQKEALLDEHKVELARDYEKFLHEMALLNPKLCKEFKINTLRICANMNPENRTQLAFLVSEYTSDIMSFVESNVDGRIPNKEKTEEHTELHRKAQLAEYSYLDFEKKWDGYIQQVEKFEWNSYEDICKIAYGIDSWDMENKVYNVIFEGWNDDSLDDNEKMIVAYLKTELWAEWSDTMFATSGADTLKRWNDLEKAKGKVKSRLSNIRSWIHEFITWLKDVKDLTLDTVIKTFEVTAYVDAHTKELLKWLIMNIFENSKQKSLKLWQEFQDKYDILSDPENDTTSWFQAMLVSERRNKDPNELTLLLRWTDEMKDIWSDLQILEWWELPEQVKPMLTYFKKLISKYPDKVFNVIWHSLWWALAQILTLLYPDKVKWAHTFNAPWIKHIKNTFNELDINSFDVDTIRRLRNYNPEKTLDNVFNTVNHDEIWNFKEHVWVDSQKLPWRLHFMKKLKETIDVLGNDEFMKYFEIFIKWENSHKKRIQIKK
ncbi:MAG: hypothetical protein ACD_4C00105G0002 [uncultured bacterium (gcode 4)]|uniref:Uncharacterized protein n=1 Tax=uncultured bacterium (gcode 4) TaxID=1234023 RepID=K2GUE4_9BACT|nr:MAG: hypothetical protein ACD_4C00105G0002 [uncultured bacterium (gcode 4)]